jgi:argonaute-like protein implicated in RNA metabolism and viral defense
VKTTELAELLETLAKLVRQLPDSELKSANKPSSKKPSANKPKSSRTSGSQKSASSGQKSFSIAKLAKYSKSELMKLIKDNQIPISVDSKDSAGNVIRKLNRYLNDNNGSKRQLRNQVVHGKTSPELSSALSYLLRDQYE